MAEPSPPAGTLLLFASWHSVPEGGRGRALSRRVFHAGEVKRVVLAAPEAVHEALSGAPEEALLLAPEELVGVGVLVVLRARAAQILVVLVTMVIVLVIVATGVVLEGHHLALAGGWLGWWKRGCLFTRGLFDRREGSRQRVQLNKDRFALRITRSIQKPMQRV